MHKIWSFLKYIFLFCSLNFGQDQINHIELDHNFKWKQLFLLENRIYCIGYNGLDMAYLNIKTGETDIIPSIDKEKYVIAKKKRLYLYPFVPNNRSEDGSYDVLIYELDEKKFVEKYTFNENQRIVQYVFDLEDERVFYSTIDLNSYMSGQTDGRMKVKLLYFSDQKEILSFEVKQLPPPNRLGMPVLIKSGSLIAVAVDDNYKISIYQQNDTKILEFGNPNFEPEPYTAEEIDFLTPLQKSVIKEGESFPPVIQKIEFCGNEKIVVTRYPRPNSSELIIDLFTLKGTLLNTFNLLKNSNDKLIDGITIYNNTYFALFESDNGNCFLVQYILGY